MSKMAQRRIGLYMQDKHDIQHELDTARYAQERGFSEIWQADTRLARDAIVMMSAFLTATDSLRIGSGVLPIWTRNSAVIAASWSTMWELGKRTRGQDRVMLGLGAWWEPIASRVGVNRHRPLRAMREYVESIRALFTMEEVTYQGDFVELDRVQLDVAYGDTSPRNIPIYIGATGPKMLELAGAIADGVLLNYVVSVDYIREAIDHIEKGARKAGKELSEIDRPELIVCCLSDEDPAAAMSEGKKLVAYYLATEPHIMKASGVSEDLLDRVQAVMSWPATEEDYWRASKIIPNDVVHKLMAVGTSDECRAKVREYVDAGVTCPVLYPMMDNIRPVIDAFVEGW
jgi:5,10-methylenetetrahydromethanopterin reductase